MTTPAVPSPQAERSRRVVVLPSPLLGPVSYEPLVSSLVGREVLATVAPLPSSPVTPARVLEAFTATVRDHAATHLVAHSNAGYYAPTLAATLGLPVVYLDAALPPPGVAETLLAPESFADFIRTLPLTDGLLPAWPSWWDRSDVATLFPDDDWLDPRDP